MPSTNPGETTKNEEVIHFVFKNDENVSLDLRNAITKSYKQHAKDSTLPELVEQMRADFDAAIPRGWVVFAGKHVVGSFSYIENTLVEVVVDGISFVVFQTCCYNK